jgi:Possible lysine decarboxylase
MDLVAAQLFVSHHGRHRSAKPRSARASWGIHAKPCALLNVNGYFDSQIAMIERMVAEGFRSHAYAAMLLVETDPNVLLVPYAGISSTGQEMVDGQ